ncbi:TetR/AcrR family transcriptional regulator [Billgrantia montanilacus]|uniref:TetR/AcrR family transcriptional regulator n=1 Tax=Billgrantia montanilacus TaxID=2282305 RepID=A0A368TYD7_9GAMM|nr:TetR/AcrR family transcriptional regulator [Halomonas montanilacus]RCV89795.1 TetR/AcrR family transcriptional regulator [Halomonas montanilacus]
MTRQATTRDPEQTRLRIMEAATDLFVEQGFSSVTMSQLASAAGVTKSLIHHHFGSKEKLWEAVKEHAFAQYFSAQMAMLEEAGEPDAELLRASVEAYFHYLKANPKAVRLFAWTHLEGDTSCGDMDAQLMGAGAEWVRQAQQRGLLRADVNPTHVVAIFVMTCTQWFEAKCHHQHWPGMGNDEAFLEDFLKIFMAGAAPRD